MMYVNYEIAGYAGAFQAGPYPADAVMDHYRDIRSYAGVYHCYVAERRDERRQSPSERSDA